MVCKNCGQYTYKIFCNRKCYLDFLNKGVPWLKEYTIKGKRLNTGRTHFKKGQKPWNKNKPFLSKDKHPLWGKHHTLETKLKISKTKRNDLNIRGEKASQWKGDKVGYRSLHERFGKAKQCVVCGSFGGKRGCHWANISGVYKPIRLDFISLCPSCHGKWDSERLPINLFEWNLREVISN